MAKALPLFAVDPDGPLLENAPLMLHLRLSEMMAFAKYIHDAANVEELHNMRIAAKRLRYTMEVFAPAYIGTLKKPFGGFIDTVKSIQEQIGAIHDCDVRMEAAAHFLREHVAKRPEIRVGLDGLIRRERAERDTLYGRFIEYWSDLTGTKQFEQKLLTFALTARPSAEAGGSAPRGKRNGHAKAASDT